MAHNVASTTEEPRGLGRCPECDYSFSGLPFQGKCPECGFQYDKSMWSIRGVDLHRRRKYAKWASVPIAIALAGWIFTQVHRIALVAIAASAIPLALFLDRFGRSRDRWGTECTLLFSDRGVSACRIGVANTTLRWEQIRSADLDAARFEGAYEVLEQLKTKHRLWRLRVATRRPALDVAFATPSADVVEILLGKHLGDRFAVRAVELARTHRKLPQGGFDQWT